MFGIGQHARQGGDMKQQMRGDQRQRQHPHRPNVVHVRTLQTSRGMTPNHYRSPVHSQRHWAQAQGQHAEAVGEG